MFAATDLSKEVRHELVTLPYYGVFDNLSYRVDGSKVTLFGQVREPKLKAGAKIMAAIILFRQCTRG